MGAAGSTLLRVTVGGVERTGEVSKCVISTATSAIPRRLGEQSDRDYTLNLTLVVDHTAGSLWRTAYDHYGDWAPIVYRPYGNTTPTASQPHYTATALLSLPAGDLMGSEASANRRARQRVDVAWQLDGQPVPVVA